MKRTPWYPGTVKPVRKGWYEVQRLSKNKSTYSLDMDFWDGYDWCWLTQDGCQIKYATFDQTVCPWRGLTEKAK